MKPPGGKSPAPSWSYSFILTAEGVQHLTPPGFVRARLGYRVSGTAPPALLRSWPAGQSISGGKIRRQRIQVSRFLVLLTILWLK